MASEFEDYRRQKLFDDLADIELMEEDEDLIVCPECGSPFYKLKYNVGAVCGNWECGIVIDLTEIEVD